MQTDADRDMVNETNEATELLTLAKEYQIETRDQLEGVAEVLGEVKGRLKRLEAAEKEITGPANEILKKTRARFAPPKQALQEAEVYLKGLISDFARREAASNAAAITEAAEAHAEGDTEGVGTALAKIAHVRETPGVSTSLRWNFEIVDPTLLPREFLTPNVPAIREHQRRYTQLDQAPAPIPGVRFFQDTIVSSRST